MATFATLLADFPNLLDLAVPAYWFALIVGGGMIVLSTLSGGAAHGSTLEGGFGGDALHAAGADADLGGVLGGDPGGDVPVDAGGDLATGGDAATHAHGPGALALSKWLSLNFVIYTLAVFGAVGLVLSYVAGLSAAAGLPYAVVCGAAAGQGVHQALRRLRATAGNSSTLPQDYVNRIGRVTIAIQHPDPGELVLNVRGTARYVPATAARAGGRYAVGEEVVVRAYRAGLAEVAGTNET